MSRRVSWIVARQRTPALDCPYCRAAVSATDPGCACGVVFHRECDRALGRCGTLGCSGDVEAPADVKTRPRPRRPRLPGGRGHDEVVLLAVAAVALGMAGRYATVLKAPHALALGVVVAIVALAAVWARVWRRRGGERA